MLSVESMTSKFKPLGQQVIVVTGASSGIGLATAEMAAERGARVVLVARSEDKLRATVERLRAAGHQADYVVADVSHPKELERAARYAVDRFGALDTWVNNAAEAIYGRIEDVPVEEARHLFEVNYFGQVNGAMAALPHLKRTGGVLINIGSVASDRAMPLIGHYSASKHAIKGFTDALRMELEHDGAPVAVTLIKPGSIDTPFTQHARNHMDREPELPPPVYQPEVVAEAILECAERPRRDVYVGASAKMIAALGEKAPRFTDKAMERKLFEQMKKDRPDPHPRGNLDGPMPGPPTRHGNSEHSARPSSAYTRAKLSPVALPLAALAVGAGLSLMARRR